LDFVGVVFALVFGAVLDADAVVVDVCCCCYFGFDGSTSMPLFIIQQILAMIGSILLHGFISFEVVRQRRRIVFFFVFIVTPAMH
jgi:hypothetical protein